MNSLCGEHILSNMFLFITNLALVDKKFMYCLGFRFWVFTTFIGNLRISEGEQQHLGSLFWVSMLSCIYAEAFERLKRRKTYKEKKQIIHSLNFKLNRKYCSFVTIVNRKRLQEGVARINKMRDCVRKRVFSCKFCIQFRFVSYINTVPISICNHMTNGTSELFSSFISLGISQY